MVSIYSLMDILHWVDLINDINFIASYFASNLKFLSTNCTIYLEIVIQVENEATCCLVLSELNNDELIMPRKARIGVLTSMAETYPNI